MHQISDIICATVCKGAASQYGYKFVLNLSRDCQPSLSHLGVKRESDSDVVGTAATALSQCQTANGSGRVRRRLATPAYRLPVCRL